MKKKVIAAILTVSMLSAVSACYNRTRPNYYKPKETSQAKYTTIATETSRFNYEDSYEKAILYSESGASYPFKYDSDIFSYVGEGGTFYLVGTDATKCFLHIIVQDVTDVSYIDAKTKNDNISEITLESGRKAFFYYVSGDEDNCHIVIDASKLIPSGKGIINCYLGSKKAWNYTEAQIANMIDKGF